ncbi:AraC-like DNA-binding protein [Sphingobium xenophagum]|uniref:AraC-like DNA-binding protein n=2 Tax=Sphingobium xenophagum TaxID=121428 RepID=A0ABU1WYH3_SPHXE|nr:AraC-like DNA-binding protein [Sphingobium xenophagum]
MHGSGSPAYYIVEGDAWIEAVGSQVRLTAGDLVMFRRWDAHILSSSPKEPCKTIMKVVAHTGVTPWMPRDLLERPTELSWGGAGRPTRILSMCFRLEQPERSPLLLGLPAMIHIRADDARMQRWLQPVLEFIREETQAQQAGYAMVSSRLADLLFMQIIRAQLLSRPDEVTGWLKGLSDPAIGRTLAAIGEDPGRRWRVDDLAKVAGVSRSNFAKLFSAKMGVSPLEHLTRHRMQIAAERLSQGAMVKTLAGELGYATSYAFAKAFKRQHGQSPGHFGRQRR